MTTHNLDQDDISQILSVTSLIKPMQDLHQHKLVDESYTVRVNSNGYQICSIDEQTIITLPGNYIIPLKTAAVSMLAIDLLCKNEPQHIAIYGIGKQAQAHINALLALYPNIIVDVIAKNPSASLKFVQSYADRRVRCTRIVFPEVDTVITATNSQRSVYSLQADPERLVIGIGAQDTDHIEIGRNTLQKSTIYTDDISSAKSCAGDLLKAEIDWSKVQDIFSFNPNDPINGPIVFKNMGAKIWDQAIINCLIQNQIL